MTHKNLCYHPSCPLGPAAQKKCDVYRAAACVYRVRDPEAGELMARLRGESAQRLKASRVRRRACPACREQTVWVLFRGRRMELCTACGTLWLGRGPDDWGGEYGARPRG